MMQRTKWIGVALAGAASIALILWLGPSVVRLLAPPTPTPPCLETTLTLGTAKFVVKPLARAADGAINVPPATPGIAYQIEGARDYVLALSPGAGPAALPAAIKAGDSATLTQANCNSTTFRVSAPQPAPADMTALLAQPPAGLVIVVQGDPATAGYIVTGELSEEIIRAFDTPRPGSADRLAEVSLRAATSSADGAMVQVSVSIANTGAAPFALTAGDVALTPADGTPLAPANTAPTLPHDFQPGRAETITFTFPHPLSPAATLRVMDAEFILENY